MAPQNILAINGSPRKGNTSFMLDALLDSAKENDIDYEIIELRKKNIKFCGGGDKCCPVNLKCHIKDDMGSIYSKLEKADMIIMASPCYFSNVSALMKNFMDRCNPYYYNKLLKGKKFFLIVAGGHEPSIKDALTCMRNFLKGVYAEELGHYYAIAGKLGEFENHDQSIKELNLLGRGLANE